MSKVVTTRLSDDQLQYLESIAKEEHLDRASLVRKWILEKIEDYQINKQLKYYRKGIVSLSEAAYNAGISIYRLLEYLQLNHITTPDQSLEEIRNEHSEAIKLINKKIKENG